KKFAGHPVRTDDGVDRFHIILSKEKIESINNTDGVVSLKSRSGSVVLNSEGIRIDETLNSRFSEPIDKSFEEIVNGSDTQSVTFPRHVPFYFETSNGKILLGWETPANIRIPVAVIYKDGPWFLRPEPNFDTVQVRSLASIFQPDRSELPMDKETSVFYFHNREAIATRSPIRLLIDLRNTLSRAVAPKDFTISLEEGEVVTTKPYALDWAIEPFFIDFSSSNFGTLTVTVQNDNVQVAKETINFYPDCIHTVVVCTQNWNMLMGYLWVTARDKKQEAMEKFESWKEDQTVRLTKWWLENSKKWYNKLPFDKLPEFQIHR
ncbi:hypothetical protein HY408_01945, partial [Candidatus Gottesmanbacteria bacterium]|nr:hypothetical protein [Candidatus Gottesmanbacteria bacterium]